MFRKPRNTDLLALANALLFVAMCLAVYYRRYLRSGGSSLDEFLLYAAVILGFIALGWVYLRRVAFPNWLLLLMQFGILAHFAGGLVQVGGARLYDSVILGLTFDKYVHALNAFAGAALVNHLMDTSPSHPHLRMVFVILAVLGGGAGVEIIEYLAKSTLSDAGVGGYDNNMQDLVANLVGCLLFTVPRSMFVRAHPAVPTRA